MYSLDAQDCVIVYCDTIEQAEDAYLDMQHLISVRGRPGDSKMVCEFISSKLTAAD